MMDKSPDAFRTISEVAEDMALPQHVLRFWETRFSQIKPLKRGGGRRYYRPDDVELLKGIRALLYDQGYTIKGVQKILKQNGNRFVIAIGAGDVDAVAALAAGVSEEASPAETRAPSVEEDALVGKARIPATRRFFGLGGSDRADQNAPGEPRENGAAAPISSENRALLQEALYDLLECKRLLDQVR